MTVDESLLLRTKEYNRAFIAYKYKGDIAEIEKLCDSEKKFDVYAHLYSGNRAPKDYVIKELSYNGKVFYSFEDALNSQKRTWILFSLFDGLVAMLFTTLLVLSVIVGRNPQKHPKLIKIFFRNECINYRD